MHPFGFSVSLEHADKADVRWASHLVGDPASGDFSGSSASLWGLPVHPNRIAPSVADMKQRNVAAITIIRDSAAFRPVTENCLTASV